MRFEQTHEILNHIRDFHTSLSNCYQHLEDETVRERARLLLDYLVTREKELAKALQDFMDEADPELLDTWFQFADESKLLILSCPVIDTEHELGIDEIISLAQKAHDCLISAFKEIITNCDSNRVSDVFQMLCDQAENQWHTLVHDANLLSADFLLLGQAVECFDRPPVSLNSFLR